MRSAKLGVIAILLLLCAGLASGARKPKSTLYAASGTFGVSGVLYTIDPATGAVLSTVGPLNDAAGKNYGITGLHYQATNGLLYGATPNASPTSPNYLVTVNPTTALVTPIGPFGAVMTDITIDPTTGIMYGVSGYNQKFYTINQQTGLATQTGSTGIGFQNGGGFASNSKGALYGVSYFSTYNYNKTTGAAALVGSTLLPNLVRAAAFDSNDVFYGLEGGGGIDNLHLRYLVTINVSTGRATLVGAISVGDLDALGFVP
ncbi:MAG: hypothetical protein ABI674_07490 [Spartobacteria bacterium]